MSEDEASGASLARFAELVQRPDDQIDLGLAALGIAAEEYPELDVARYAALLDEMGAEAKSRTAHARSAQQTVEYLSQYLAGELGFRGNQENFEDPRNSFFNDVIDRRLGIPITLSAVYMEVGRRAGLAIEGIGFPGHFLAKYVHPAGFEFVLDPFNGGRILDDEACQRLLDDVSGGRMAFSPLLLRPAPKKQILVRMLNNLKQIYYKSHYFHRAIRVTDMILTVSPSSAEELRERGLLHAELANYAQAKADLEAFLERSTDKDGKASAAQSLQRIESILRSMD